MNRPNAKVSRQIHWCEEPADSSDSEDEIAQQRVNVVEMPSRAHCRRAEPNESAREYKVGEQQVAQHDIDSGRWRREWRQLTMEAEIAGDRRVHRSVRTCSATALRMVGGENELKNSINGDGITTHAIRGEVQSDIEEFSVEPPRMLKIEVNGVVIPFELDTGASMSIMDDKTWRKLGCPEVEKTEVEATAYNNRRIAGKSFFGQICG